MLKTINKPNISKWIGRMYFIVTVLILALYIWIGLMEDIRESDICAQAFLYGVMIFVVLLMATTTYGFYKTRYVIQNGRLYSWSPFAIIRLKLKDIKKIERTLIPFHFRFGASLYSGRFYIPKLGWTKTIMTNLSDGVLITAKNRKYYLITPSNPERFMKLLKKS